MMFADRHVTPVQAAAAAIFSQLQWLRRRSHVAQGSRFDVAASLGLNRVDEAGKVLVGRSQEAGSTVPC